VDKRRREEGNAWVESPAAGSTAYPLTAAANLLGKEQRECSRAWGRLDGMARCERRVAAMRRTGRGTSGCAARERRRGGDGVGAWAGRIGVWRVELGRDRVREKVCIPSNY
jgi:hypothetical protein